jgi:hypothetical protein
MAIDRSVTAVSHDLRRGENVWAVLCHAALRSIEWAADACGARDAGERIERTELLVEHGTAPLVPPCPAPFEAAPSVDWAQLGEADRAVVARVVGPSTRGSRRWQ